MERPSPLPSVPLGGVWGAYLRRTPRPFSHRLEDSLLPSPRGGSPLAPLGGCPTTRVIAKSISYIPTSSSSVSLAPLSVLLHSILVPLLPADIPPLLLYIYTFHSHLISFLSSNPKIISPFPLKLVSLGIGLIITTIIGDSCYDTCSLPKVLF